MEPNKVTFSSQSKLRYLQKLCATASQQRALWLRKCFDRRERRRRQLQYQSVNDWQFVDRPVLRWDRNLRIATWNVRTMASKNTWELIVKDLHASQVSIACIQECRWTTEQIGNKWGDYKLWGGGAWPNHEGVPQGGVAILVHRSLWRSIGRFQLISGRVATMSFQGQLNRRLVICSVYAPTESDNDIEKDKFWSEVHCAINGQNNKISARDFLVIAGDFNGELPSYVPPLNPECLLPYVVGRWGCGNANTNGLRLHEEAANAKLCDTGSIFRRPFRRRWTFYGNFDTTNSRKRREYDHILIPFAHKAAVQSVNIVRYSLHDSDHCLVVATMKPMIKATKLPISASILTKRLRSKDIIEPVDIALHNRFGCLEDLGASTSATLDDIWQTFSDTVILAANSNAPSSAKKPWISEATLTLIHEQASLRKELFDAASTERQVLLQSSLKILRRSIRQATRNDWKQWVQDKIVDLEHAHSIGNSRHVFQIVRALGQKSSSPPASLEGTDPDIWVKHFRELLGKAKPPDITA